MTFVQMLLIWRYTNFPIVVDVVVVVVIIAIVTGIMMIGISK